MLLLGGCWEATTSNDNNSKWKDEVQLFDFHTITVSTNNFSLDCKIGQGGFSSVYKVIKYLSTLTLTKMMQLNT